uniref:Uncharacterized protein n=1 Tax=Biomphalaria glabrata TaxID=6526 RepID=A0A2C9KG55_BIOGL
MVSDISLQRDLKMRSSLYFLLCMAIVGVTVSQTEESNDYITTVAVSQTEESNDYITTVRLTRRPEECLFRKVCETLSDCFKGTNLKGYDACLEGCCVMFVVGD